MAPSFGEIDTWFEFKIGGDSGPVSFRGTPDSVQSKGILNRVNTLNLVSHK